MEGDLIMQIKFSSKLIKITFDNEEPFSGRSVRMKGEPLANGFDAALHSAEWIENHLTSPISPADLTIIKNAIIKNNDIDAFKISFMGE